MRPLTLHASALSDAEYDFYTSSLNDIADDTTSDNYDSANDDVHYESKSVGVREFRAWLRGRYSHVPASIVDTVLKFFLPSLGQGDILTGGQFFAALRLVVHIDNGKQVDRSLAFVQAAPCPKHAQNGSSLPPPPPLPPSRHHHDGTTKSVSLSLTPTVSQMSPASTVTANNPFTALSTSDVHHAPPSSSFPQAPPQHPKLRVDPTKASTHSSYNPFTKANPTQKHDDPSSNKSPPLPPRKPPPPAPPHQTRQHAAPPIPAKRSTSPIRQSIAIATPLLTPYGAGHLGGHPAPTPATKPVSHVTSTLIKQSLHASKVAQSLKKAEEQLEKERIMQVLKSSSGSAARNRSTSPTKGFAPSGALGNTTAPSSSSSSRSSSDDRVWAAPPLPKRREQLQQFGHGAGHNWSPPLSASSYEQVALAGVVYHRELTDGPPPSPGPSERGRRSGRASSVTSLRHETPSNTHSHPNSVVASTTSSPSRACTGLPVVPPPTHPDRRERDEKDKSRRYSSVSVHSGKSNTAGPAGRLQTQPASGAVDTRTFDSVYGSLVSPVITGDDSPRTPASDLPHVQTNLVSPLSNASLDSPTPTDSSPTTRVFRSRSLHHPSTPPPVPPPLRKKRPESVQVAGGSQGLGSSFHELVNKFEGSSGTTTDADHFDGEGTKKLSRHLSLSGQGFTGRRSSRYGSKTFGSADDGNDDSNSSTTRLSSQSTTSAPASTFLSHRDTLTEEPLSLASLQRTFTSLQPKLDKVRYKAEAGISRRGFIQGNGVDGASGESRGERQGLVRQRWKSGSDSSSVDEESLREVESRDERMAEGWTPL